MNSPRTWRRFAGTHLNLSVAMLLGGSLLLLTACGDDDSTTAASTTTSSTSSATTGGGGNGGSGGGGACFVADGSYGGFGMVCAAATTDDTCITCARAGCCAELTACDGNSNCQCLLQCFLDGCDPVNCLDLCPSSNETTALTTCAANQCGNECIGN